MAAIATSSGPRYAPEDPSLPKPWKGLVDGKTGYLYFWNPETNVTQYERPMGSGPPLKSSSLPISSSVHIQQSSQGPRSGVSLNEEKDSYERGSNDGSKLDFTSKSQQQRCGTVSSTTTANGALSTGHGGPSRGHGISDGGSGLSAEAYRRRHEITVTGDNVPPPFMSFEATGFPSEMLREVSDFCFLLSVCYAMCDVCSWEELMSYAVLPSLWEGLHLVWSALIWWTNSFEGLSESPKLVAGTAVGNYSVCHTVQMKEEASSYSSLHLQALVHNAGFSAPTPIQAQSWPVALQSRDIVAIAKTGSGKTLGYLFPGFIHLKRVHNDPRLGPTVLVLSPTRELATQIQDEAVKFSKSSRISCVEVPTRRQTLMYTATWPKEVRKIAADLLVNPVQVNIGNVDELVANKSITQNVELLAPLDKHRRLEQILRSQDPGSKIIIFCSTKKMCDQLARNLARQFGAAAIHGDKSQSERDFVLNQFRTGRTPVLVATDVAARGLDIKDIRVVINYDFPTGVEDYVHRIGRTGRAGASGVAYTFFGEQDAKYASNLIKVLEGANQRVPPEIRDMASRGGGMNRFRRWASGSSGRDGGRGGCSDSSYGGRDGGRGGWGFSSSSSMMEKGGGRGYDSGSRDRVDRGYQNGYDRGRSRSRSPQGCSARNRERSRSRSLDRAPRLARSFHQAMMEKARPSSPPQKQRGSVNEKENFGGEGLVNGGYAGGPHSSHYGDEAEEGMIPQDE
ncbi:ATP-dependent RNA helicase-like protein DB [Parasponia andersonii]|uniref:RNA helicase n=1 Tax=Parasponia andersonii TaxID=3476 RepID=A0A2P5BUL5_PARAD|nr:ATP-dependent RNA helicase-like protein DB [Parasponia andersonii]